MSSGSIAEAVKHLNPVADGSATDPILNPAPARRRRAARQRPDRTQIVRAERVRVARELHDVVGQALTTLLVQIRIATARGEAGPSDLRLLEVTATQALAGMRSVAYGLRQPKDDPMEDARQEIVRMASGSGVALTWVDERTELRVGRLVSDEVAASIKESVANLVRHSHADTAVVSLTSGGGRIAATIRDNGVGFTPEAVELTPDGRGLGLLGMKERLEAIGGCVQISSAPGQGTTVRLEASSGGRPGKGPSKVTLLRHG